MSQSSPNEDGLRAWHLMDVCAAGEQVLRRDFGSVCLPPRRRGTRRCPCPLSTFGIRIARVGLQTGSPWRGQWIVAACWSTPTLMATGPSPSSRVHVAVQKCERSWQADLIAVNPESFKVLMPTAEKYQYARGLGNYKTFLYWAVELTFIGKIFWSGAN